MISFTVPGEPVAFARAGANGGRRFTPKKQSDYMAVIKTLASQAMGSAEPLKGSVYVSIDAKYLHPSSWSTRRKYETFYKTSKPDADNIAKLFKDAMSKIVFVDDAQVALLFVRKIYSATAEIQVCIEGL